MAASFLWLSFGAAAGVAAEEPWDGRWAGDPSDCFGSLRDTAAIEIGDGIMRFYESQCILRRAAPTSVAGAWIVEAACEGEGAQWTRHMVLMLSGEHGDRLTLFEGDFLEYARCR
ncbi:MAG: hypothetical protein AAGC57_11360 [Pseudomonadota bacterium]